MSATFPKIKLHVARLVNGKNCQKLPKIAKNCQKLPKIAKNHQIF
jgi:hypothetical protein